MEKVTMTPSQGFMKLLEDYYGSYRATPELRKKLMEWLEEQNLPLPVIRELYETTIRSIGNEYSRKPDIKTLDDILNHMYELRTQSPQQLQLPEESYLPRKDAANRMSEVTLMLKNLAKASRADAKKKTIGDQDGRAGE